VRPFHLPAPRPPPYPSLALHGRADASARTRRGRSKKLKNNNLVVACRKREEKNVRFSVFNPRDPRAPWASRAKPREEEGFFGLVPLVIHPSSIPLLGGLTPKVLDAVLTKSASIQPLFSEKRMLQLETGFWYF
jgi:hypothetical protein